LAVLAVVMLMFGGGGKISTLMGDVAKGVKEFRTGLRDDENDTPASQGLIPQEISVTDNHRAGTPNH
jgi:sec-independent protein translocase protein TatA